MSLKKIAINASEEFLIWIVENYYNDIRINLKEIGEYTCEPKSPFEIFAYTAMRKKYESLWHVLIGVCNFGFFIPPVGCGTRLVCREARAMDEDSF